MLRDKAERVLCGRGVRPSLQAATSWGRKRGKASVFWQIAGSHLPAAQAGSATAKSGCLCGWPVVHRTAQPRPASHVENCGFSGWAHARNGQSRCCYSLYGRLAGAAAADCCSPGAAAPSKLLTLSAHGSGHDMEPSGHSPSDSRSALSSMLTWETALPKLGLVSRLAAAAAAAAAPAADAAAAVAAVEPGAGLLPALAIKLDLGLALVLATVVVLPLLPLPLLLAGTSSSLLLPSVPPMLLTDSSVEIRVDSRPPPPPTFAASAKQRDSGGSQVIDGEVGESFCSKACALGSC